MVTVPDSICSATHDPGRVHTCASAVAHQPRLSMQSIAIHLHSSVTGMGDGYLGARQAPGHRAVDPDGEVDAAAVQQALHEGDVQDAQRRGDAGAPDQRLVHVRVPRVLPHACVGAAEAVSQAQSSPRGPDALWLL